MLERPRPAKIYSNNRFSILIPIRHRCDVRIQTLITHSRFPTQRLNRYLEVFLKADRVGDMPAVKPEALVGLVNFVRRNHLGQARVGRGKGHIFVGLLILKIVGTAKIIFRAGATNGWKRRVAIEVKLDLAFTPPARAVHFDCQISAHVLSFTLDAVEDGIEAFGLKRSFRAKLRMKVTGVIGYFRQRVVYLVIKQHVLVTGVFHRDSRLPAKRHGPVTVERAPGIHANCQRADLTVFSPIAGEEVAHRRLDRRVSFAIPVEAENGVAPVTRRSHPNVIDATRPLDVSERESRSGLDYH